VTKNHLSWKTTKENSADKLAHGTKMRGESHPTAKLKASDVAEIKAMRGVVPHRQLAERFGVSISHISRIQSGRAWRD
jgi:transcriptional regulator with XRE-family HTH domain